MPLYEYACTDPACGNVKTVLRSMQDRNEKLPCDGQRPSGLEGTTYGCGKPMALQMSAPSYRRDQTVIEGTYRRAMDFEAKYNAKNGGA